MQITIWVINNNRPSHPIIGLTFDHQPISPFTRDQLPSVIEKAILNAEHHPLIIKAGDLTEKVTARQLGAHYDEYSLTTTVLLIGRNNGFWHNLFIQDLAFLHRVNETLGFPNIDQKLTRHYLARLSQKVDTSAHSASFSWQDSQLIIKSEKAGAQLDTPTALSLIKKSDPVYRAQPLQLPTKTFDAPITKSDLEPLLTKVQRMTSPTLVLKVGDTTFPLTPEQLLTLIVPVKEGGKMRIAYNDNALNALLDGIAAKVNQDPKPKVVTGEQVLEQGQAGIHIDGIHAKVEVLAGLTQREISALPPPATLTIPIEKLDAPTITSNFERTVLGEFPAVNNGKKAVTLTFDDGPNGTYTDKILDILKAKHAHAIFFLIGQNVNSFPKVTKRILAEGHTLGNHSFTHSDLAQLNSKQIKDEIVKTQKSVFSQVGANLTLFRPPYGSTSAQVNSVTSGLKLQTMMWSIDPRDWARPGKSVIVKRINDALFPGANILLHVLYQQTVDALPDIIDNLKNKGYVIN